jgi:hypothetical protein
VISSTCVGGGPCLSRRFIHGEVSSIVESQVVDTWGHWVCLMQCHCCWHLASHLRVVSATGTTSGDQATAHWPWS